VTALALVKLLILSLFLLAAVRLLVTIFLGDCEVGPAIGVMFRGRSLAAAAAVIAGLRPRRAPDRHSRA
jgi:hypothetical protein